MRIVAFLLLGLVCIALQTTLFQLLPKWIGMPDLLFLLIIFMSINFKVTPGALLTLTFATLYEVFSGYFLGLYVFAYLFIFFLIKGVAVGLAIDESNHQPPLVAISYLIANGFVYIFSIMLADQGGPWDWGGVLQRVLIVTVLVVPVNRLLRGVMDFCENKDGRFSFFGLKKENKYNKLR